MELNILFINLLILIVRLNCELINVKILVNKSYGGFSFSEKFYDKYKEIYNEELEKYNYYNKNDINKNIELRYDKKIMYIYEKLGKYESSGKNSIIEIEEILFNDINRIKINEFYGFETLSYLD